MSVTQLWRWLTNVALPCLSNTGHLHEQRGDHAMWHDSHGQFPHDVSR